uniref:Uncharacterized protein n=1 Tax=Tetraselmis sp. GSL018 TaxID=582737 RepID=A0A061RPI9_9CHLO
MGVQCAATPLLKLPSNRVKLASTRSESAFVYARPSRDTGSAVAGAAGHLLQRSYTAGVHIRRRKLHSLVGNRLLTGPGGGFGGGNSGFGNGGGGGGGEYGGWGGASGSGGDRWPALVLELLLALVRGVCAVYSRLSVKHPYLLSSFLTASTFFLRGVYYAVGRASTFRARPDSFGSSVLLWVFHKRSTAENILWQPEQGNPLSEGMEFAEAPLSRLWRGQFHVQQLVHFYHATPEGCLCRGRERSICEQHPAALLCGSQMLANRNDVELSVPSSLAPGAIYSCHRSVLHSGPWYEGTANRAEGCR